MDGQDNEINEIKAMDPVKLTSVANNIEGGMLEELLNDSGIPVYRKSIGSGGAMQAYMGYSIYGEDVYVDRADYERALELLELLETPSDEEVADEAEIGENLTETTDRRSLGVRIFKMGIRVFLIIFFLLLFIKACSLLYIVIMIFLQG